LPFCLIFVFEQKKTNLFLFRTQVEKSNVIEYAKKIIRANRYDKGRRK